MKTKLTITGYIILAIGVYNIMSYFGTAMLISAGVIFVVAKDA